MNAQTIPTMTTAEKARIMELLTRPAGAPPVNRLVRWTDAAREASLSTRTLRTLAREGALVAVTLPGRKRTCGVTADSLAALVQGGAA